MLAALSKVVSESLLSLYPVFVKNMKIPIPLQMWSRFAAYVAVSALFVDYKFVWAALKSWAGVALMGVTLVHIYTSYKGFVLLESGPAYTLFYIYPMLILLLAGNLSIWLGGLAFVGALLLASAQSLVGVGMIVAAAFTEALIYFLVKRLKTTNNWNHLFLSYVGGAVLFSLYYATQKVEVTPPLVKSLGINAVIGMAGYLLRFYSMSRLPVFWYAMLSNVGIVTSYAYGYAWNGEVVHWKQIAGSVLVAAACLLSKF
jgi:drug/metabolite transporter (DMT)-like permease